jgi:nitronate monooxygenase
MTWTNTLTGILNIQYPVIQAPMLGASTPEMAAAVSNQGGLGSLAVGGLSPEATRQLIGKTKSLTNKPFAVNLFAHQIPACSENDLIPMKKLLLQLAGKRGYELDASDLEDFRFYTYHDQLNILLQEEISIISFTFGCLDANSIQLFKDKNCTLIGTATSVDEALFLQQQQIDIITLQGIEAGGHRGSFLDDKLLPQVALFSLLPLVKSKVHLPCIAAGGINSAQTMNAAFTLGADAVQIGTAFLGTNESTAIASYKNKLTTAKDTDTTLTRAFSGRWARGIRSELMREIELAGIFIPPYPWQNSLTAKIRNAARQNDDSEYINLWAGQSAGKIEFKQTAALFRNLVEEYEAL